MKKINFKRTWWVLLIMLLFLITIILISVSIDTVLSHPNEFREFLDKQWNDKYTYQDILVIIHTSYFISLITALILLLWHILWTLFIERSKK